MEDMLPCFRFYPTEEELVSFYLRLKLQEEIKQDLDHLIDRLYQLSTFMSSIHGIFHLRHEFSLCRIYKKSKCIRSFDRRPPAAGGEVLLQIQEPTVTYHQGQVNVGVAASATHQYQNSDHQIAVHEYDRRTMSSSPPESTSTSSSGSGDHGNNINNDNNIPSPDQITWESNSSSAAMAVDYDECFWNLEGFWDSISKT